MTVIILFRSNLIIPMTLVVTTAAALTQSCRIGIKTVLVGKSAEISLIQQVKNGGVRTAMK